ncbi:MAG TPA: energy-coupling factor transporter transmembrane component T [Bacillota bacterium]|nr:energy-coupling factor transporter transmembrane component T [Bacillota bacterium]
MQSIFDYVERNTLIHRLHPMVKLLHIFLTLILIVIPYWPTTRDLVVLLIWVGLNGLLWAISRLSLRQFGALAKVLIGTFIFILLMQSFLYRGGTPLLAFADIPIWGGGNLGVITREGLLFGIILCVRILAAVFALPLFVATTPVSSIMAALTSLRLPPTFIFMFVSALTFTGMIFQMWSTILDAQRLRAFDIEAMNLIRRLRRAYVPVLTPLVLMLFRKGNDLQIALESKGFGAPGRRTEMIILRFTPVDAVAAMGIFAVFVTALWLKYS